MNRADQNFREYVTSTAFNLQLSAGQCAVLAAIGEGGETSCRAGIYDERSLRALIRRGLIGLPDGAAEGWKLSRAGELVLELVKLAEVGP